MLDFAVVMGIINKGPICNIASPAQRVQVVRTELPSLAQGGYPFGGMCGVGNLLGAPFFVIGKLSDHRIN